MPTLQIVMEKTEHRIPFTLGATLAEILNASGVGVRSGCGGNGRCGLCKIFIEHGGANKTTESERTHLTPHQIRNGLRLACRVLPQTDLRIRVADRESVPAWHRIDPFDTHVELPEEVGVFPEKSFGVAVDLGTTNIRLSLWDMAGRTRLSGRSGPNPQARFGADVLTRLGAASESPDRARKIGRVAQNAIEEAIHDMVSEAVGDMGDIRHVAIAGNTAMLALLTGKNHTCLIRPDSWEKEIDCRPDDPEVWNRAWGLDTGTTIDVLQPLGGFVGSDILAGLVATNLIEGPPGSLLIDFGTNSEMALWDGRSVWVASAAGGPAFEGCGIRCGMPAEPGAICKFTCANPISESHIEVIGGGEATGICGSGLVDIIADLLKSGYLKENGHFAKSGGKAGLSICKNGISVHERDIDVFQCAKAAIGAGLACLLKASDMRIRDLRRACVCGAFGRFLNIGNAQAIGLLPDIPAHMAELSGNTALAGCEHLLFVRDGNEKMAALKRKCKMVNLARIPEFEDLFVENLFLWKISMATREVPT